MTRLQRQLLAAGATLCLLVLLFPSYGRPTSAPHAFNEGRTFVLELEPINRFTKYARDADAALPSGKLVTVARFLLGPFARPHAVVFDHGRTLVELLGIALATGLGYAAARPGNDHGSTTERRRQ